MSAERHEFITFSDIDGTLVHYLEAGQLREVVGDILQLPVSSTGKLGIISQATLVKAAQLRQQGSALVLVSGARTSTVLQRLPFLPAADAIVAENGGRIWYPDPEGYAACPLKEDLAWRQQLSSVTGPIDQDVIPPHDRKGPLWDWYRQLLHEGWRLDANSYSTAFRLKKTPGRTEADLQQVICSCPSHLGCSFNLGVADFYPSISGKDGVAIYLMQRFGVTAERTALLCDDDNDMKLAALVGKAFLPSISHASVEAAVAAHPERFVVADVKWTAGTEQMLDAVQQHFKSLQQHGQEEAAVRGDVSKGQQQQQQQQHAKAQQPLLAAAPAVVSQCN